MPVWSKRSRKCRAVPARARLRAKAGDIIAFDFEGEAVCGRKAEALDLAFAQSLESTLAEWGSSLDEEAYRDL
jgi:hypothetical protein